LNALPESQATLSAEAYRQIDRELAKFPAHQKRSICR